MLNVAFENPRKTRLRLEELKEQGRNGIVVEGDALYMVPDRISGLEELEELRRVCPGSMWNFVNLQVLSLVRIIVDFNRSKSTYRMRYVPRI